MRLPRRVPRFSGRGRQIFGRSDHRLRSNVLNGLAVFGGTRRAKDVVPANNFADGPLQRVDVERAIELEMSGVL
jgi:hypothetical protein